MRVLALDWGRRAGVAVWDNGQHDAWVSDWDHALDVLVPTYIYSSAVPPSLIGLHPDLVVCEDFIISQRTVKSAVAEGWKRGRELMLIGATEFMCRQTGTDFVLQSPAEAKAFSTDVKLRTLGWWRSGPDHANDASRHLLLALVQRGLIDLRTLLEPVS